MSFLVDALDACPGPVSYAILGLAVFAESVLLVGAFVPTLTLMLAAGALSRTGHLELAPVVIVAATAVVLSDFAALTTGRRLGTRLRTNRIGARVPAAAWARTEQILRRRPGSAVLLGRFVPVARTLVPHLAGASGLRYRQIAPYSAIAALYWATLEATAGYAAGGLLRLARSADPGIVIVALLTALFLAALAAGVYPIRAPHGDSNAEQTNTRGQDVGGRAAVKVERYEVRSADRATPVPDSTAPSRTRGCAPRPSGRSSDEPRAPRRATPRAGRPPASCRS